MLSREGKQTDRGAVGAEFIGYNRRRREALLLQARISQVSSIFSAARRRFLL